MPGGRPGRAPDGVREVAERFPVGTALLHLGGVRFPATGPVRWSMTARAAARLCRVLRPRTAVPVHYEGWSHFRQDGAAAERQPVAEPPEVRDRFRWLPIGEPVELPA